MEGQPENTAFTLELLERLRPYLGESLIVLDRDWTIKANLARPGGLIGHGLGVGLHTLENMHPDDTVTVLELGAQMFDTEPGWQGSKIVRLHTGDGTYRRYELTATNRFDDPVIGGMVVRTREVLHDANDELEGIDTSSTLKSVAELLPMGLLLLDDAARIVYANRAACELFDRTAEQLRRCDPLSLVAAEHRAEMADTLQRLASRAGVHEGVVTITTEPTKMAKSCFSAEGIGHVTHIVVTFEDVTQTHAAHLDLAHRASHDELTGLQNRWSILDSIQRHLERGEPTNVAYVDLDGFKEINDIFGHDRGDRILVRFARLLESSLGDLAELARIGGDEFVVVWCDGTDSETVTARIHEAVGDIAQTEGLNVAASVGTAAATPDDTHRGLLRRADKSMYQDKSTHKPYGSTAADTGASPV